MRRVVISLAAAACCAVADPAIAQERFRISVNAGQQVTAATVTENDTFQLYLEEGSFTFERAIPKGPFYDASVAVRVWRGLHVGAAVSMFEDTGTGSVTARIPHPFFFNQQRSVTGEIADVTRREIGRHVSVGWAIPVTESLDLLAFGGPSSFSTDQVFVPSLTPSLDKEVYPFETLAFPGAVTEKRRQSIIGYNAGADVTWRFTDTIGAGFLLRYTHGEKDYTVGGLHAGGGLRVRF
jgi:hypothetical protein